MAVEAKKEILTTEKSDRRLLANVPDATGQRNRADRRTGNFNQVDIERDFASYIANEKAGIRYDVQTEIKLTGKTVSGENITLKGMSLDISSTGMLVKIPLKELENKTLDQDEISLTFEIKPGAMPEGYETKIKDLQAKIVRRIEGEEELMLGISFVESLAEYVAHKRGRYMLAISAFFLLCITMVIVMMRAESVIYFKFNRYLYLYSIIAATFLLSRYLFATFYRPVKIDSNFTPGVTIIIPCFNEEDWIQRTIHSCINQDYPVDKLEVIVVDDHSNDSSVEKIKEFITRLKSSDAIDNRYKLEDRISYYVQPVNQGKREAMATGAKLAKHELLVFVDSDSFLDPYAVRNIVQPFKDKEMGGVSGRTDVANTYTNALTKMQSVRYYIAFRVMKAAEGFFDAVTCLSGPLSCYRKDLVLKYSDAWLHQTFLGQRATFGDDRSMTNFILRHNRTTYQDTAFCSTIVPSSYKVFLKQQMRWKRSWLRESLIAARYIWKKEPFMSLSFYMGLVVPIAAPIIVLYNLVYVPILHRVFPVTFLVGMLMMALLMSMAQLFLRRSSTWLFGMWFCFYYEAVLLWQMPVAWFTFWKSTWGTRMTPADLAEKEEKEKKKVKK